MSGRGDLGGSFRPRGGNPLFQRPAVDPNKGAAGKPKASTFEKPAPKSKEELLEMKKGQELLEAQQRHDLLSAGEHKQAPDKAEEAPVMRRHNALRGESAIKAARMSAAISFRELLAESDTDTDLGPRRNAFGSTSPLSVTRSDVRARLAKTPVSDSVRARSQSICSAVRKLDQEIDKAVDSGPTPDQDTITDFEGSVNAEVEAFMSSLKPGQEGVVRSTLQDLGLEPWEMSQPELELLSKVPTSSELGNGVPAAEVSEAKATLEVIREEISDLSIQKKSAEELAVHTDTFLSQLSPIQKESVVAVLGEIELAVGLNAAQRTVLGNLPEEALDQEQISHLKLMISALNKEGPDAILDHSDLEADRGKPVVVRKRDIQKSRAKLLVAMKYSPKLKAEYVRSAEELTGMSAPKDESLLKVYEAKSKSRAAAEMLLASAVGVDPIATKDAFHLAADSHEDNEKIQDEISRVQDTFLEMPELSDNENLKTEFIDLFQNPESDSHIRGENKKDRLDLDKCQSLHTKLVEKGLDEAADSLEYLLSLKALEVPVRRNFSHAIQTLAESGLRAVDKIVSLATGGALNAVATPVKAGFSLGKFIRIRRMRLKELRATKALMDKPAPKFFDYLKAAGDHSEISAAKALRHVHSKQGKGPDTQISRFLETMGEGTAFLTLNGDSGVVPANHNKLIVDRYYTSGADYRL